MQTIVDGYKTGDRLRYHGFSLSPDDPDDAVIIAWLQSEPHPTAIIKGLLRDALEGNLIMRELPDGSGENL